MSGTHLYYNGVMLRDCELRSFEQSIERDQSGTDVLFNRFRITVASTLVSLHSTDPNASPQVPAGDPIERQPLSTIALEDAINGESVVDRLIEVRRRLHEPRRDFWFGLNAVTNQPLQPGEPPHDTPDENYPYRIVLAATGVPTYADRTTDGVPVVEGFIGSFDGPTEIERSRVLDVDNGPKPMSVSIEQIFGGRAMRVVFTIEVCRLLCGEDLSPSHHPVRDNVRVEGIISNRWSITESLNENWETTHTIDGVLRVSDQRYKAMAMRLLVTPALFPYAALISREYGVDTTGLVLKYRCALKEEGYAPPPGVIQWSGSYTESTTIANSQRIGELQVKVRSVHAEPAGFSRREAMLVALHDIARSRIAGMNILAPFNDAGEQNAQDRATAILQKIAITETLGKPEMTLRATVLHVDDDMSLWRVRVEQLGTPMVIQGYDHRWWPAPPIWSWDDEAPPGYVDLGNRFDQYYQDPCSQWHAMPRGVKHLDNPASLQGDEVPMQFMAYQLGDVDPDVGLNHQPAIRGLHHSWSSAQLSDATYYTWEGDDTYDTAQGVAHLPLSTQRNASNGTQTAVAIQLHAPIQRRRFTMIATRANRDPEIPYAAPVLDDKVSPVEYLLARQLVAEAIELQADGVTTLHGVKVVYEYGLSRPVGLLASETYRRPSSPRDLSTPDAVALNPSLVETHGNIER